MIQSMTGYGKSVATFKEKKINVEIKSLNSKSLDLSTRITPLYREKEMEIRQLIAKTMERGKIDFSIWIEKDASDEVAPINTAVVQAYYQQIKDISKAVGIPEPTDWFYTLLRMPDVTTKNEVEELTDEEWAVALQAINSAIDDLIAFRKQEGKALQQKFTEKINNITNLLSSIEPYEKSRVEKIRQNLIKGLESIPGVDYDKNRLEQELIYYIEKLDISEEKQRLTNHLKYFRETMNEEGHGVGKKLGFIAQEMGREINTTGSKSNQAEMQNIVVKMKDELEQIKEQVLNASGTLTVGLLAAFLIYVQQFFRPVQLASQVYTQAQAALAGAERIYNVLDEEPEPPDPPGKAKLDDVVGGIEFESVTFAYEPGRPVLHDVSFEVEPGQTLALVGPTGAGKTTIANLIPRFYDVSAGAVRVDGRDVREVERRSLRTRIATVLQEPFLFSGTLAENIGYGRWGASREEIEGAARAVSAHDFIAALPDGYATTMGTGGGTLSGGQRQLVSFSRAVLADPRRSEEHTSELQSRQYL